MAKHVNVKDGEIKQMFTTYSLLFIKEHAMKLNRAIDDCGMEYEILIDAVINSQKGVIQPQLIKPAQILEQVKHSEADMPSDISLPIPTSATYQHLVLRIVTFDVFLKGKFLMYVIHLPLTMYFSTCTVSPLPIKVRGTDSKLIFIQPERDCLLMHTAKRYFTRLGVEDINYCKNISKDLKICKQMQPLQLTHLDEEYEPHCPIPRPGYFYRLWVSERVIELMRYSNNTINV